MIITVNLWNWVLWKCLLNKIIENEIDLYKEYKNNFENDLYKTRELMNLTDNICNKEIDKQNESYIIYSIKLL